jgi:hypothetical protein
MRSSWCLATLEPASLPDWGIAKTVQPFLVHHIATVPHVRNAGDATGPKPSEGLRDIDGSASARRELEAAIGQPVHLVYVPNTRCRPLGAADIDLLCQTIARTFPSAMVQTAEGIHESRRRSMLIGRIRTDSSDAVVDLAQRLCIAFDEPFIGIEVDGRYIRIYGDDTA